MGRQLSLPPPALQGEGCLGAPADLWPEPRWEAVRCDALPHPASGRSGARLPLGGLLGLSLVVGLCCVGSARVGHPGVEKRSPALPVPGQAVVDGLLSLEEDCSLLLSQFCQYLEQDDVRYHAMQAAADTVARVTNAHPEVSWREPHS